MIIPDVPLALHQLEHIGYYRLSAYWHPFRSWGSSTLIGSARNPMTPTDTFKPDTHFTDALALYTFDKQLRLLLMDALAGIEIALRVDIAYVLGARDGFAHLTPESLHPTFSMRRSKSGRTAFENWQEKHTRLLNRSKEDFVKRYQSRHGSKLPIWIAIEVWDFGAVSQLLAMMKVADQSQIAHKYGVQDWRVFQSWLRSLNYLRNVVAHHSRLWNRNVIDQPKLPVRQEIPWCDSFINKPELTAKPFPLIAIVIHMLKVVTPHSDWQVRMRQHLDVFPDRKLSVEDMGVPADWQRWWDQHVCASQ